MLKTEHLKHTVAVGSDSLTILNGINLHITQGETAAIIGASGSGKSTLLGILAGLDRPTEGNVFIHEKNVSTMNEEERADIRSRYVAFVFQNFQLLSSLTALENVMLPLEVKGVPQAENKALRYLERVGLSARLHHRPTQLSGGEQQRVALARAFACEAPIIFADEPTGNLDADTGDKIADLLFELNKEHSTTLIMVTHSSALAERCHRQFRMHSGVLTEESAQI